MLKLKRNVNLPQQLQNAGPLSTMLKRAGSFGSAVDVRTWYKLFGLKSWVHIFSGSFGSAVDVRT